MQCFLTECVGVLGDSDSTSIDLVEDTGFLLSQGASGKKHKISPIKDDLSSFFLPCLFSCVFLTPLFSSCKASLSFPFTLISAGPCAAKLCWVLSVCVCTCVSLCK